MGQAELVLQFANPISLGTDRVFERSLCAAAFPTAAERSEQRQDDTGSSRAKNDQHQRCLLLPHEELDGDGLRVLQGECCRSQGKQ